MDAQQFLAEFGHIANAPGGIVRLRVLVLHLAMTGKLVQQIATDEHADQLLERMRMSASQAVSKKRGKQKKSHSEQQQTHKDRFLPTGWAFSALGDLGDWGAGSTPSRSNPSYYGGDVPWFKSGELKADHINKSEEFVSELALKECSLRLNIPGDVLIAMYGANIGQTAIVDVKCTTNQAVCACTPHAGLSSRFLLLLLRSLQNHFIGLGAGGAQPNISKEKIIATTVELPPTDEQSRIVAKVDELMTLCDKLEAQQQDRRKLQNNLRLSTLQAVATATSPRELQTRWTRLADNFARLFHAPEDVADLRKMLSELAIRGALDAFSEPTDITTVDVYLSKLASKKSGKRFAKSVQVEEDISLPNGWRRVLMEDLLAGSESGWSPKCDAEPRRIGEWGVLKISAVTWGTFNPDANKRLPSSLESRPECEVKPGDFMLSRANTADLIARSVIAPDDCPDKLLMSDKIVRLKFLDEKLKPWVNLVNNSDLARAYYKERATGTSDSMRNISRQVIHELPIPLPSPHIQERVLQTLTRLMCFCDELERQASSRMKLSAQFSTTAIFSITGITTEQKEEPMKAPRTELIAPLRSGKSPDIKAQAPLATILARHNGEMPAKDLWNRFGGGIDTFYAQLKIEVANGWIDDPTYDLEDNDSNGPKSYPDGKYVAKMILKERA